MAYLLCKYKEEKDYICAIIQLYADHEHDITPCRVKKEDYIPLDKEHGLIRLIDVESDNNRYLDRIRVEIYDAAKGQTFAYYVPRDNVQMTAPVKR